jgi:arsenite methyltransferase
MARIGETEIKLAVREKYSSYARNGYSGCCGSTNRDAPEEANKLGLGCGSPVERADIKRGMVVLDLGSGGGIDVFAASKKVGRRGCVIGVDATMEMVLKARKIAKESGHLNVEFRLGEIENLPVESGTIDVVISNCAINLVPDKKRAFEEIFRVLKPGGWLTISDIVALRPLPEKIRNDEQKWSACVAGAITKRELARVIESAGLRGFSVLETSKWEHGGDEVQLASMTFRAHKPKPRAASR